MKVEFNSNNRMGAVITKFNYSTLSSQEIEDIKDLIYRYKIVVIKHQDLSLEQYCKLGCSFGEIEKYYQPMYHHPEKEEIFVSSNIPENEEQIGVPKTGKFWHADYAFMPQPLSFSMIYPQALPNNNRGTYFIDMAKAFKNLPDKLKNVAANSSSNHSVRRYFKVRPEDVYRPISEILDEIEKVTPPSEHPTTFVHPVTEEIILYITEGFTYQINNSDGKPMDASILTDLLFHSGQLDRSFEHSLIEDHTFELGDIRIWDNRALAHCAHHTVTTEPTVSFRLTMYDDYPFHK